MIKFFHLNNQQIGKVLKRQQFSHIFLKFLKAEKSGKNLSSYG